MSVSAMEPDEDQPWPYFHRGDLIVSSGVEELAKSESPALNALSSMVALAVNSTAASGVNSSNPLITVLNNSTGSQSVFESKLIIPLYAAIFLLAVVGNSLVLVTLVQNKRMRTVTNVYLLNLVSFCWGMLVFAGQWTTLILLYVILRRLGKT